MFFFKHALVFFLCVCLFSGAFGYSIVGLPNNSYSLDPPTNIGGRSIVRVKVLGQTGIETNPNREGCDEESCKIYVHQDGIETMPVFWLVLNNSDIKVPNNESLAITDSFERVELNNAIISLSGETADLAIESSEVWVQGSNELKTTAPGGTNGANAVCRYVADLGFSEGVAQSGTDGKSSGNLTFLGKMLFSAGATIKLISYGGKGGNTGTCNCDSCTYEAGGNAGNSGGIFIGAVERTVDGTEFEILALGGAGGSGDPAGNNGQSGIVSIGDLDAKTGLTGRTPSVVKAGELYINSEDNVIIDSEIELSNNDSTKITFNFCETEFESLSIIEAELFEFFISNGSYFWDLFEGKIEGTEVVFDSSITALMPRNSKKFGCTMGEGAVQKQSGFSFYASVIKTDFSPAEGTINSMELKNPEAQNELESFDSVPFIGLINMAFGKASGHSFSPLLQLWLGSEYFYFLNSLISVNGQTTAVSLPMQTTNPEQTETEQTEEDE